ncbi:MAG: hypothetical protein ACKO4Q_19490 [Planctomycetota bacterium]
MGAVGVARTEAAALCDRIAAAVDEEIELVIDERVRVRVGRAADVDRVAKLV